MNNSRLLIKFAHKWKAIYLTPPYNFLRCIDKMTHEQIAQHISSAREAVARMLKSFSEDGLVELKRGAITLRDTDGLNHLK